MKSYLIKPESIDLFGSEANAYTVLSESDIENLATSWEKPVDDLLSHLIEDDSGNHCYRVLYRFPGSRMTREQINERIAYESGDPEEFFATNDDYRKAIENGFVTWDAYYTTIWIDD